MMKPNALYGNFIHEISILLDRQKVISFDETLERIQNKTVISWLKQELPEIIATGLLNNNEYVTYLHDQLENIITCKPGRFWGTKNNGLCLLLSATAELIEVDE